MLKPLLFLSAALMLASCVTSTPAPPPTAMARTTGPSTAALLPWYTNDAQVARTGYDQLSECLARVGLFTFAPRADVERAVTETGAELEKVFGPSDADFKAVGQALDVDYVLGGAFTVMNELTFAGWRKDITADIRVHDGRTGAEVGYWRSNTGFTWTSTETALDAAKMSESAMNHMCAQIQAEGRF